jgi:hypothetical protein
MGGRLSSNAFDRICDKAEVVEAYFEVIYRNFTGRTEIIYEKSDLGLSQYTMMDATSVLELLRRVVVDNFVDVSIFKFEAEDGGSMYR